MKRVMCLRFWNWQIQRQQQQLPSDQRSLLAIHTLPATDTPQTGRRKKTADRDESFVREIFPSAKGGPTIVCSSDMAWDLGVRPGMPLAEARSMAAPLKRGSRNSSKKTPSKTSKPETQFYEWTPDEDNAALMALAEHTRQFAPIVGLDETPVPDSLLLDVTGCGQLFGGETALAEQLVKRMNQNGFQCSAVISDSVATAWAFAHVRGHFLLTDQKQRHRAQVDSELRVVIIPPGQTQSWLEPLPLAAARIPYSDIQILNQLGILTLKQLFGLPVPDLPSRLSDPAINRLRQITGVEDEMITAIPEADPVSASWVSEFPATNRAEIRQVIEHLMAEIEAQLERRAVGAIKICCQLKQEDKSVTPLEGEVIKPVQSAKDLLDVLNLRLESMRIDKPIFCVDVSATIAPLMLARQKDLFNATDHIEPAEELATVVNRLSGRLGKGAVLTAMPTDDPVPEQAYQLKPVIESDQSSSPVASADETLQDLVTPENEVVSRAMPTGRPICLLPQPVRLLFDQTDLVGSELRWNNQNHTIAELHGPERIETQWWHESSVHRDYYRAVTSNGGELWIFREVTTGDWFLHGSFE